MRSVVLHIMSAVELTYMVMETFGIEEDVMILVALDLTQLAS